MTEAASLRLPGMDPMECSSQCFGTGAHMPRYHSLPTGSNKWMRRKPAHRSLPLNLGIGMP
eukprot:12923556-Heterocapsa_arctica.AAC.1